jgi:hypothetical protein
MIRRGVVKSVSFQVAVAREEVKKREKGKESQAVAGRDLGKSNLTNGW